MNDKDKPKVVFDLGNDVTMEIHDDSELAQREKENLALDDELKSLHELFDIQKQWYDALYKKYEEQKDEILKLKLRMQSAANELDALDRQEERYSDGQKNIYYFASEVDKIIDDRLRGEEE